MSRGSDAVGGALPSFSSLHKTWMTKLLHVFLKRFRFKIVILRRDLPVSEFWWWKPVEGATLLESRFLALPSSGNAQLTQI